MMLSERRKVWEKGCEGALLMETSSTSWQTVEPFLRQMEVTDKRHDPLWGAMLASSRMAVSDPARARGEELLGFGLLSNAIGMKRELNDGNS